MNNIESSSEKMYDIKWAIEKKQKTIAFLIADLIVERLQMDFWLFDMIISIVFVMIMLFVSEKLVEKIRSKF